MKKFSFAFLLYLTSCAEEPALENLQSQWSVAWAAGDERITGRLFLYKDHYAHLQVYGVAGSMLVRNNQNIGFYWSLNEKELTLKRIDNHLELNYQIVEKSPSHIKLAFADDIMVSLSRD